MRRILCLFAFLCEASALTIAVVGGGTSGVFAALSAAEQIAALRTSVADDVEVKVFESTDAILRAAESNAGGGILHDTSKKPRELLSVGYPRGRKEITSLLTKFPPLEQQRWFEHRGVIFVTQADGSMIQCDEIDDASTGTSNNAFVDALVREAESHGITILTNSKVTSISRNLKGDNFFLSTTKCTDSNGVDGVEECDAVIMATGNSRIGHKIAQTLGHTIMEPVRSCFGLKLKTEQLDLPRGNTYRYPHVRLSYKVKIEGQKRPRVLKSEGPIELEVGNDGSIILTGLATFSLTSIAAHELKRKGCEGQILMHCCPYLFGGKVEKLNDWLWQHRQDHLREVVGAKCPLVHRFTDYDSYDFETDSFRVVESAYIPPAVWEEMVVQCGATSVATWGKLSPKKVRALADLIVSFPLEFRGRHTATSGPFINAGGVALNEVDMSSMKSKMVDGVYFCGQILDGDASYVTFNTIRDLAMGRMAGVQAAGGLVGREEV